jgi:hypothetical protein
LEKAGLVEKDDIVKQVVVCPESLVVHVGRD